MTPLPCIEKSAGIDIEEWMLSTQDDDARQLEALAFSGRYARIAVCRLLGMADSAACHEWLCLSADAYAAWVESRPPGKRLLASHADPFFCACAAGHRAAAQRIAARVSSTWHQGAEYEEDFSYARCLHLLATAAEAQAAVIALLAFWKGVSGGREPRFALCQALLDGDTKAAVAALARILDARLRETRKRKVDEDGDPDEHATTDQVSIEGAAIVWIARQRGLKLSLKHSQLPASLLRAATGEPPAPDAWRTIPSYRSLQI